MQRHKIQISFYNKEKDTTLFSTEVVLPTGEKINHVFIRWLKELHPKKEEQLIFLKKIISKMEIEYPHLKNILKLPELPSEQWTFCIKAILKHKTEDVINIISDEANRVDNHNSVIYAELQERFALSETESSSLNDFFLIDKKSIPFFMNNIEKGLRKGIYDLDWKFQKGFLDFLDFYTEHLKYKDEDVYICIINPDIVGLIPCICHRLNILTIKDAVNHPEFINFVNKMEQEDLDDGSDAVITDFFREHYFPKIKLVDEIIKNEDGRYSVNILEESDFRNYGSPFTKERLPTE